MTADHTPSPSPNDDHHRSSSSLDSTKLLNGPHEAEVLSPQTPVRDEFRVHPISQLETTFRHSRWAIRRRQTWQCLCRCNVSNSRLDRFANCGSGCVVEAHAETGEVRLSANYCRDRLCLPCGVARSARVTAALVKEAGHKTVRFATFTLKHSETPLTAQIDRLYRSFSALRRRKWFASKCVGGAAILEVKLGRDGLWHVHLHTLLLGSFLDQKDLSREWHETTGDSYIVDVRKVDTDGNAIRYCASYVGKPVDAGVYQSPDKLDEACRALHGRRIVNTWGKWAKLDLTGESPTPGRWVVVGLLRTLVQSSSEGDTAATVMLAALQRTYNNQHNRNAAAPDG